jgi:hypothetical protein
MAESLCRSKPVTALRAMMGVPNEPKATGAVLAINDRPQADSGRKPRRIRIAEVTATGVPKPAAPSKKAPKEKAIRMTWMRGSGASVARLPRRTSNRPRSTVSW